MKCSMSLAVLLLLSGCGDYDNVESEYEDNNPNARELLLKGLNSEVCRKISHALIKRALKGDEEAKLIIYAQMEMLRGMPEITHVNKAVYVPRSSGSCSH